MNALSLKSILTTDVVTCGTEEALGEVLRVMERKRISCIVVIDGERRPCGIFTERDAVALLAADGFAPASPVREAMSRPVVSFPLASDFRDAYQLMLVNEVHHLVAVDAEGRVAGVLTEADLLADPGDEYLVAPKTVAAAMTRDVTTLDAGASLQDALRLMHKRHSDHVVVTEANAPVGMVTDRDVVRFAAGGTRGQTPLADLIARRVHSIAPGQTLQQAAERMAGLGVRRLLVIERDRMLGVLTRHDIVRAMQGRHVEFLRETIARLRRELARPGGRHGEFGRHMILGSVFDRIADGVVLADATSGAYVEANDRACELLGFSREEILSRHVWEISNSFADATAWRVWSAGLTEQVRVVNTDYRRGDGSLLPVEVRVYQVHDGERQLHVAILRDFSATRQIEAALREGERYYRHVIDSAVDGYFAMDPQRRFIEVNDTLCNLFGYPREEWLGQTPIGFIAEESRAELIAQMQRIDTTDRRRYQLIARRKDGTTFPILLNNTTHRNEKGGIVGSFGFITDLTPIVEAQRAVAESERELRGILDDLQDTYYRTDQTGTIVRASRSVEQLLGYTAEEMLGRKLTDFYCSQADRDEFLAKMQANGGHIVGGESRLRHRDGHELWVITTAHFIRDAAGNVVGVEGTTRDNTRQRRAEEELRLAAKVFESSGEAIMITDAEGCIISVNQAFSRITGHAAAEVVGRNASMLASGRHGREFFADMWRAMLDSGYWHGEIWNRRRNGEIFPEWLGISSVRDGQGKITHFVGIFADISERKAAEAKIAFLAHHDPLTGLPNRLLLKDRMEQAMVHGERNGNRVALLFVDLDRFKAVNDAFGHPVGDALLRDAAQRLLDCVRDSDTISRHGGDEFLVVLTDLQNSEVPARIAAKIMAVLGEPFHIDDHEATISASVGIAVYPEDGAVFDELLKKADIAMYHAKEAGRNAFRFYTERMNADAQERIDLHSRLRRALDRGEFVLHYQPLIDLKSGRIVGGEALLRWQSPERGLIEPEQFITAAEHSGLIVPLGEWVLQEACRELAHWHAQGYLDLSMAVNISAIQFRRGDVEETVLRALAAAGATPAALELELTESILIDGAEQVLAAIRRLQAIGVRLAIDDFGSGYSSLAYLKRFAVDKLKIDQSFVRDIVSDQDDAAIVRAVIQMARSLNLKVLAEGVESEAVAEQLRAMDCDLVQGYHFGRPMPAAEFRDLIGAEPG
ncbi:MAG: PAS domain S-box protein [Sulfuritalea sp.]|nr:PAS domain S-box protein [Sulfuritalea sp.]